jgi:hypothetical protein
MTYSENICQQRREPYGLYNSLNVLNLLVLQSNAITPSQARLAVMDFCWPARLAAGSDRAVADSHLVAVLQVIVHEFDYKIINQVSWCGASAGN